MGKVLSQEEIDALINDAKKGKDINDLGQEKKAVEYLYDWKNPQKLNPDAKRQLKQIFQIFATSFQTYLQSTLKSLVDINLIDMSTVGYSDYLLSVSEPTCMYKVLLDKLKAEASIEMQPAFVYFIVDRLLGGFGRTLELSRPTTDIENSIMRRIMQNCLVSLKDAWRTHIPGLNFQYNGFENNPNFVNIAPATDLVAVFTFEITIKDDVFNFTICFPSRVLEPILEKLSVSGWQESKDITRTNVNIIEDYIKFSMVDVIVELGKSELSVGELQDLQKGDVLELEKGVNEPLLLKIDGKPKYFVKAGVEGNKKAFEFIRRLTPEEERKHESR